MTSNRFLTPQKVLSQMNFLLGPEIECPDHIGVMFLADRQASLESPRVKWALAYANTRRDRLRIANKVANNMREDVLLIEGDVDQVRELLALSEQERYLMKDLHTDGQADGSLEIVFGEGMTAQKIADHYMRFGVPPTPQRKAIIRGDMRNEILPELQCTINGDKAIVSIDMKPATITLKADKNDTLQWLDRLEIVKPRSAIEMLVPSAFRRKARGPVFDLHVEQIVGISE